MTRACSWICSALLSLTGLWAQTLQVSPAPVAFRMAATGPNAPPHKLTVSTASATPVKWTAAAGADAPWISVSPASGTASASSPAAVSVSLVGWRAQAQKPGTYDGTVTFSAPGSSPVAVKVTWTVVARRPDPVFSYLSGPKNCTNPGGYPDPAVCTVPDEKPPGNFTPPAVGGSFTDADFGGIVRVLTGPGVYHTYSNNNPLSANNKYLMTFTAKGVFDVVDVARAKVVFADVKANQDFVWDSYNDSVYYYPEGAAWIKHDLAKKKESKVVDYSRGGFHFTVIKRGGTTATSKDNWVSFFAPAEQHLCTLDLNTVTTYCADYSKIPGPPLRSVDYVLDSKGVDKTSGKRYVIIIAGGASAFYSVNVAGGRLDLEYRSPEDPESSGNHDGVCDPGEKCLNPSHSDTMEDASGTQYLVYDGFTESPCEVSLATYQLNKGLAMALPVELGGGRRKVMSLWRCPFPNAHGGTDEHIGCAKNAPFCVVSTVSPIQHPYEPTLRFPHASEVLVMRGNGDEIRRLVETRSVRFAEDGEAAYWSEPRAAISNDGSLVVFDSNYGNVNSVRVNLVETGFGNPAAATGAKQ